MNVPGGDGGEVVDVGLQGQRSAGDPDVLFVHAVGEPQNPFVARTVVCPRRDAADILGADAAMQAGVALDGEFALNDAHVGEMDSIGADDGDEGIAIGFRGIVNECELAVGNALAPDFSFAGDERGGHMGLGPGLAVVGGGALSSPFC